MSVLSIKSDDEGSDYSNACDKQTKSTYLLDEDILANGWDETKIGKTEKPVHNPHAAVHSPTFVPQWYHHNGHVGCWLVVAE